MRAFLALSLLWTMQVLGSAAPNEQMSMDEALRQDLLLIAVRPDYPYEARRQRFTGSGIFELRFDYETGRLREVHVEKSTGQRMLDGHAIGALKLWKAKPRSIHTLRVPIAFELESRPGFR